MEAPNTDKIKAMLRGFTELQFCKSVHSDVSILHAALEY